MTHIATHTRLAVICALVSSWTGIAVPADAQNPSETRFEIVVPEVIRSEPLTGRAYVMIARTDSREPRLQIGRTGEPFFGRDVEGLRAGGDGRHRRHRSRMAGG